MEKIYNIMVMHWSSGDFFGFTILALPLLAV